MGGRRVDWAAGSSLPDAVSMVDRESAIGDAGPAVGGRVSGLIPLIPQ